MERAAERIMELRAERDWSIRELSKRSGVGVDTISHLERGHTKPHPRTLYKLARAFDVPMDELLGKAPAPWPEGPWPDLSGGALLRNRSFNARTMDLYGDGDEGRSEEQRRRERVYGLWRDLTNDLLDRWETKAETGNFDRSAALEFNDTLKNVIGRLAEAENFEIAETPPEERGESNENLILNRPIRRLLDLLPKLEAAYEAKLKGSELEQLRKSFASVEEAFEQRTG